MERVAWMLLTCSGLVTTIKEQFETTDWIEVVYLFVDDEVINMLSLPSMLIMPSASESRYGTNSFCALAEIVCVSALRKAVCRKLGKRRFRGLHALLPLQLGDERATQNFKLADIS